MHLCLITLYLFFWLSSIAQKQCCIDPVHSFIIPDWSGPCACQTLSQKWNRYTDWIQMNGGYIHPDITFDFVNPNDPSNRGMFSTKKTMIQSQAILMQIPISISFTQFIISKYIPNSKNNSTHSRIFGTDKPTYLLPPEFPDFDEFLIQINKHHDDFTGDYKLLSPSIAVWMALGLSWLKTYTLELLPWISLLPSPYYLPFLFEDKEYLFKGTEVEIMLNGMEYDFLLVYQYLNILGITEQSVREIYALIHSRFFSMDFSHIGGLPNSPTTPCGADFFNSDSSITSEFPFYDELFGDIYYGKYDNKNNEYHHMTHIIPKIVEFIGKHKVEPIDFMSSYYFVTYPIYPKREIFGSYGVHSSHVSMALYGYIEDKIDPNDYINILFRNYNDEKYQYFHVNKSLSLRFMSGYKQLHFKKELNLSKEFQLLYLPQKYMDSFTISSIINGFEWKYISQIIGPIIEREIQWFCYDKLMYLYPNSLKQDYNDLNRIKQHLKYIETKLNDKTINLSKNRNEKLRLSAILQQTQEQLTITKYIVREKQLYIKCTNVNVIYIS